MMGGHCWRLFPTISWNDTAMLWSAGRLRASFQLSLHLREREISFAGLRALTRRSLSNGSILRNAGLRPYAIFARRESHTTWRLISRSTANHSPLTEDATSRVRVRVRARARFTNSPLTTHH